MIKGQKSRKLAGVIIAKWLRYLRRTIKTHLRRLDEKLGGRRSSPSDCRAWRKHSHPSPGTSRPSRKHLCPRRGPAFQKGSVTFAVKRKFWGQKLRRAATHFGQGQTQKPFKGLEVQLRTLVKGIQMSLAAQPVDGYQNLDRGNVKRITRLQKLTIWLLKYCF